MDKMGKEELRAACKAAGIKGYGKWNNTEMRTALNDAHASRNVGATVAETVKNVAAEQANVKSQPTQAAQGLTKSELRSLAQNDAGTQHADKRMAEVAAQVAPAPVAVVAPVAAAPVVSAATGKPVTTRTGIKVEANREERNGLVRPSAGGICRAMWDAVEQSIDAGKMLTAKEFKVLSEANGWNWNNASAEYYKARQFRGITGRVK